ncbi:MAG: hypothetical protein ACQEUT_18490 [Bacillota bacterium]
MDQIDYVAMKSKIDELTLQNIRLQKDNRNMIKSILHYKRIIKSYKQKLEEKEKKKESQHYRNGQKRGRSGRNG